MKPSVLIELDKPRNIRLTTNALVMAEELIGKPLPEMGQSMGIREVRIILWAGLLHEDRSLSPDDVGELMDYQDMEYVGEKVGKALQIAIGGSSVPSSPN
jgi:hypothetical protein